MKVRRSGSRIARGLAVTFGLASLLALAPAFASPPPPPPVSTPSTTPQPPPPPPPGVRPPPATSTITAYDPFLLDVKRANGVGVAWSYSGVSIGSRDGGKTRYIGLQDGAQILIGPYASPKGWYLFGLDVDIDGNPPPGEIQFFAGSGGPADPVVQRCPFKRGVTRCFVELDGRTKPVSQVIMRSVFGTMTPGVGYTIPTVAKIVVDTP